MLAAPLAATMAAPAPSAKDPAPAAPAAAPAATADGEKFFLDEVKPILVAKCGSCHSGDAPQGKLKLTSRASVLKGGSSGPAVSLEHPERSLIVAAVNYQGRRMPPQGKLAQKDINTLTRWVRTGLPWAAGEAGNLEPKGAHSGPPPVTPETMKFWSFQKVRRPAVPAVKAKWWVHNAVDSFVLAKLEANGLKPAPYASRQVLIRRAYYDLLGLPPSPEEVEAFVNDKSPNAWEKVVDKLLASPQYGERWGRHWLDLVRFAETNSYERDGDKPNAWRYRDYVINSFNADKRYDQFITEQLAGDEMTPQTPERLIATGYYRLGIWDDEPVDPEQALYDDLDDIVVTTGQTFLGLTIGCARCHDHKLDPIPTKDYYRFLAFFSGLTRFGVRAPETIEAASERPIGSPEQIAKAREAIQAHRALVKQNADAIQKIEAKVFDGLQPVEKQEWQTDEYRPRLIKPRVGKLVTQEEYDQYLRLRDTREELKRFQPPALDMALCVTEIGKQARDQYVLLRGGAHAHGEKVEPGFLSVLAPPEPQIVPPADGGSSGRRTALAKWIASKDNPLTARVMVNRIWHYHFGRGIVRSTSNFGFQGDKPGNEPLLDWLASEFTASGWHMKPIHKLIMMSAAYQISSAGSPAGLKKDPENELQWRFNMRRLEAEEVRDSVMAVNGSLNLKMGGPDIYPTIPPEVLAGQSMPGAGWHTSPPDEQRRRSVYIFIKRSLQVPIIASFDGAETDFSCPERFATTQPTQALGMLNSAWINEQARVFADYLKEHAGPKPADQVRLCLTRTLQRPPTQAEVDRGVVLIASLQADERQTPDQALTSFCVVALNLNEFLYLD